LRKGRTLLTKTARSLVAVVVLGACPACVSMCHAISDSNKCEADAKAEEGLSIRVSSETLAYSGKGDITTVFVSMAPEDDSKINRDHIEAIVHRDYRVRVDRILFNRR
jgi:hypothetical protein